MIEHPGEYVGTVVSAEMAWTSNNTEQIAVRFDFDEGSLTWYGFFTDRGLPVTLKALKEGLGFDLAASQYDLDRCCAEIVGKQARCVIEEDDYQGRRQLKIRWVNSIDGGGGIKDPMTEADKRAFVARLKAGVRGAPPARPDNQRAQRPAPAASGGPSIPDDDIPF